MSRKVSHFLGRTVVPVFDKDKVTVGTGYIARKVGNKSGDVTVCVDLDQLFQALAKKTLQNKSGKSVLQGGAITLIASNIKTEPI